MTSDSVSRVTQALVEYNIQLVDWNALRIIVDRSPGDIPSALLDLSHAQTEAEAENAYWRLDNRIIVQGQLFEAAEYVIEPLLAALTGELSVHAKRAMCDLFIEICGGVPDQSEAALGNNELGERSRAAIRAGLLLVYSLLNDLDEGVRERTLLIIAAVDEDEARLSRVLRAVAQDDSERVRNLARELEQERVG